MNTRLYTVMGVYVTCVRINTVINRIYIYYTVQCPSMFVPHHVLCCVLIEKLFSNLLFGTINRVELPRFSKNLNSLEFKTNEKCFKMFTFSTNLK